MTRLLDKRASLEAEETRKDKKCFGVKKEKVCRSL
jgi:hypothetical protein